MTALTRNSVRQPERFRYKELLLTQGLHCYAGGVALLNLTTGRLVRCIEAATGYTYGGIFLQEVDATAAAKKVTVDLGREVYARWVANATGGDAVTIADVGKAAYGVDDDTVSDVATGRTSVGIIWDFDAATNQVLVEFGNFNVLATSAPSLLVAGAALAFAANDCALTAAQCVSGALFNVPATAGNSTVTLPDDAPDRTIIRFAADGTNNGHTVTYRQAGGGTPVSLTAATTASRRHAVTAIKNGTTWVAHVDIGPA